MASIIWPASLPQEPLVKGSGQTPQEQTLRSAMDAGIPKTRRRYTAGLINHTVPLILTAIQLVTFKTFYYDTTQAGSLRFDWSYYTGEVRFKGPFKQLARTPSLFNVSFEMEELP